MKKYCKIYVESDESKDLLLGSLIFNAPITFTTKKNKKNISWISDILWKKTLKNDTGIFFIEHNCLVNITIIFYNVEILIILLQ